MSETETKELIDELRGRGWTRHDDTVLKVKAPRRLVLLSPPHYLAPDESPYDPPDETVEDPGPELSPIRVAEDARTGWVWDVHHGPDLVGNVSLHRYPDGREHWTAAAFRPDADLSEVSRILRTEGATIHFRTGEHAVLAVVCAWLSAHEETSP